MMMALEPAIPNIAPIGKHKNNPEAAIALSEGLIEACKAINTAPCAMPVPRPLRELVCWMWSRTREDITLETHIMTQAS